MGGGGLTSFVSSGVFLLVGVSATLLFLRGGDVGVDFFLFDVSVVIFLERGCFLFGAPFFSRQM
jgi:hypothetical protein